MDRVSECFQSFALNPRRTVSPFARPLARQRREGFFPASCARPARLATPRKFRFRNARRAMRAADVCFPLLLFDSVHPCLVGSRLDVGATRAPRDSRNEVLHGTSLASAGRVLPSFSTHRGAFSSPRASRDRTSGTSVAASALLLFEGSHSDTTETVSARPPSEGCRAPRSEVPSIAGDPRPPSEHPFRGSGHRLGPSHGARFVNVRAPLLVSVSLAPPRGHRPFR